VMLNDRLGGVAFFRAGLFGLCIRNPREAAKGWLRRLLYRKHLSDDFLRLMNEEPQKLFGLKLGTSEQPPL